MKKLIGLMLVSMSFSSFAEQCSDVIKLSMVKQEIVKSESSFLNDAKAFCDAYSKNSANGRAGGGTVGYGGFSLGNSSAKSNAEAIASKLCKSNDTKQVSDNAYNEYINSIAPGAYDAYAACLNSDQSFRIMLMNSTETEATIRVGFNPSGHGVTADVLVDSTRNVSCKWLDQDELARSMANGNQNLLKCFRNDSAKQDAITIINTKDTGSGSSQSIPWAGYVNGVPRSLSKQYEDSIGKLTEATDSFKGAVAAFEMTQCPKGWSVYEKAYGRFIRGINLGDSDLDKNNKGEPREPGSLQEDSISAHQHELRLNGRSGNKAFVSQSAAFGMDDWQGKISGDFPKTEKSGGKETRPKNVALLYCQKD